MATAAHLSSSSSSSSSSATRSRVPSSSTSASAPSHPAEPASRKASRTSFGSANGARSASTSLNKHPRASNGGASPLGAITNRNGSSFDEEPLRKMSSSSNPRRGPGGEAMPPPSAYQDVADRSGDRVRGPRSSLTGGGNSSRVVSHRVPSALRRLPPGGSRVTSRTILPSGTHSSSSSSSAVADGSSSAHPSSSSSRPGVAALARTNVRRSLGATLNAAGTGGAAQHDRDGREINKLTVDSTSFEEWMKMATDNKINATNTWNFALIDYFHDMSLLRSDNGDGSINFQKASCTLDGCVKVWTSRVDSVVVETGKLLSGLQDDAKESSKSGRGRDADEDEDGDEMGDGDEAGPRKKRSRAKEPTLVKSFNQLAVKKLELEFTVDPLFKKTSADFDEGGAGGLLMNHLGVDSKARVVFDASDVPGQDDVEDEAVPADERIIDEDGDDTEMAREHIAEPEDQIDLTKLRAKLFGQHDYAIAGEEDALGSLLGSMTVCPTFATFRFAPDDKTTFSALMAESAPDQQPSMMPFTLAGSSDPTGQDWDDDMNDGPAYDDGMDDAFGDYGGAPTSGGLFGYAGEGLDFQEGGAFDEGGEDFNVGGVDGASAGMRPSTDYTTSMQGLLQGTFEEQIGGDDFFGYFDQRMSKNWAGPEHWKMRNVVTALPGTAGAAVGAEKGARKVKEPFLIDFTSSEGAVASKVLFETAKGQAGTLMASSKDSDELYLLPEDRHFSSRQLLRLFIKPNAMLNPRRQGQLIDGRAALRTDADADVWVHAAAQRSGSVAAFDGDEEGGMPSVPYDTQFFHEDDGGFDPMDEAGEHPLALEPEDEEELATQALKRIRPEYVNYAKKAKRVDVRKLKDNIWRELAIAVEDDDDDEGDASSDGPSTPKAAHQDDTAMNLDDGLAAARVSNVKRDPTDPRTFDSVLAGLRKLYAKDRMDEISTSFCFICLLHLANEEGLRIRTAPDGIGGLGMLAGRAIVEDDEEEEDDEEDDAKYRRSKSASRSVFDKNDVDDADEQDQQRVGYLEYLSIAKDPNAGRSA